MSGLDRRLLQYVPAVRGFVWLGAAIGVASALLVIAQAGLLAEMIAAEFLGGAPLAALTMPLVALAGVVVGRPALGWAAEAVAGHAATTAVAQLRAALRDHVLRLGPRHPGLPSAGQPATLASRATDRTALVVSHRPDELPGFPRVGLPAAIRRSLTDAVGAAPPDRGSAPRP
jgi:ATP-binding cassette, subfamily C, bacterial CydCD